MTEHGEDMLDGLIEEMLAVQVEEETARKTDEAKFCPSRIELYESASSGWSWRWDLPKHADDCELCRRTTRLAFRIVLRVVGCVPTQIRLYRCGGSWPLVTTN